ncbi:MAG TPA: DUF4147 domain-containing protein, partial [Blastocatellia bacterium]|nr:DUF4147 domain-containing protein [Blastocatellia bacterium]
SLRMGWAVEQIVGDRLSAGVLVSDRRHKVDVRSEIIIGGHPFPNEKSLAAGRRILDFAKKGKERRLIIVLISGGGSALVEWPASPDMTLEDVAEVNRVLVRCGAPIREMNLVRKHMSAIKGGRLGQLLQGQECLALYISDVNSGDLLSIASNPLLPEESNTDEFYEVVKRYDLVNKFPAAVSNLIRNRDIKALSFSTAVKGNLAKERGAGESPGHTPDKGRAVHRLNRPVLPRATDVAQPTDWFECGTITGKLLMDNRTALDLAADAAKAAGFKPIVLPELVESPYQDIADAMIDRLIEVRRQGVGQGETGAVCLISGGEVACPVNGAGTGGRNQEFVLYSAAKLASRLSVQNVCIVSLGTDGIDGNSPAAGAISDPRMIGIQSQAGLDPDDFIARNDSFSFFRVGGGLIVTGPTGNNVRDLRMLLSSEPETEPETERES